MPGRYRLTAKEQYLRDHFGSVLFFHISIHRYLIVAPRIALTSIKQLISLCRVDG
jgi:hypothetical protein